MLIIWYNKISIQLSFTREGVFFLYGAVKLGDIGLSGELLHVIDGVKLYMSQGDVILLNKNALQEIRCLNPQTMIVNVCMKENLFSGTLKNYIMEDNPASGFLRYENARRDKFGFFKLDVGQMCRFL